MSDKTDFPHQKSTPSEKLSHASIRRDGERGYESNQFDQVDL